MDLAASEPYNRSQEEALRYFRLAHAVMGAVMFGWGVAMMYILFSLFRAGNRAGWLAIAVSIATWYLLDTAVSLLTGFWQNALLNTGFALLFAIPLAATYRVFTKEQIHEPIA